VGANSPISNGDEGISMEHRFPGALTIDFEDYRRQELRDHCGGNPPPNPLEVERQTENLLQVLADCDARATFFSVGRLVHELTPATWRSILASGHRIGCHGFEHLRVYRLGQERFARDLHDAKAVLEDAVGESVVSFRAPYFSVDGCDPWFGETLAEAGFRLDSSQRLSVMPEGFTELAPLSGAGDTVREVPLLSIGPGRKRLTVIGGTYLRVLPMFLCRKLVALAKKRRFLPMVYLHPYDVDPHSESLDFGSGFQFRNRLRGELHRLGRSGAAAKLKSLAQQYSFQPIEDLFLFQDAVLRESAPTACPTGTPGNDTDSAADFG
jgi:Polysaccharide deacetylase/Domain of unknown function (DUF3473)